MSRKDKQRETFKAAYGYLFLPSNAANQRAWIAVKEVPEPERSNLISAMMAACYAKLDIKKSKLKET